MLKVGDKVIVRENIEIIIEGEENFINELATVSVIDNFVYPVELRFKNPRIQKIYAEMGCRRFDTYDLEKIV